MHHAAPQLRLSSANILTDLGRLRIALVDQARITAVSEWDHQPQ